MHVLRSLTHLLAMHDRVLFTRLRELDLARDRLRTIACMTRMVTLSTFPSDAAARCSCARRTALTCSADEFARLARGANGPPGRPGERPVSFQHGTAPGKTLPAEYGILSRFGYPYSADGDG